MELKDEHAYGRSLGRGTVIGLALLAVSFLAYLSGALPPYTPPDLLPELWKVPVSRYLELTSAPTGWHWLSLIRHGDYLTVAVITLITLVTPLCYVQLAVSLSRKRTVFAPIAWLQLAVFAGAAILGLLY